MENTTDVIVFKDEDYGQQRSIKGSIVREDEFLIYIDDGVNEIGVPKRNVLKVKRKGGVENGRQH